MAAAQRLGAKLLAWAVFWTLATPAERVPAQQTGHESIRAASLYDASVAAQRHLETTQSVQNWAAFASWVSETANQRALEGATAKAIQEKLISDGSDPALNTGAGVLYKMAVIKRGVSPAERRLLGDKLIRVGSGPTAVGVLRAQNEGGPAFREAYPRLPDGFILEDERYIWIEKTAGGMKVEVYSVGLFREAEIERLEDLCGAASKDYELVKQVARRFKEYRASARASAAEERALAIEGELLQAIANREKERLALADDREQRAQIAERLKTVAMIQSALSVAGRIEYLKGVAPSRADDCAAAGNNCSLEQELTAAQEEYNQKIQEIEARHADLDAIVTSETKWQVFKTERGLP